MNATTSSVTLNPLPSVSAQLSLANAPVTVDAPKAVAPVVKKDTWLDQLKKSPHGEALAIWGRGVGVTSALVLPPAIMASAGAAIGSLNGSPDAAAWGIGLGVAAGVVAAIRNAGDGGGAVALYRKSGHKAPWLAVFRDTMAYLAAPAIAAGLVTAELATGGCGVAASVVAGLIGGGICLTTDAVRTKRLS